MRLLVVSDPHWAGPRERLRRGYERAAIANPLLRLLATVWRRGVWLADPLAHNHRLDRILEREAHAGFAVANGDYTVDTAFVGISDDASCESAAACVGRLRAAFGDRLRLTVGDHDLGKHGLFGGRGGPRLESWRRLGPRLGIDPVWRHDLGKVSLVGVPSTPIALEVFRPEILPAEAVGWEAVRREVLAATRRVLGGIPESNRVILFCHDPTALPFLAALPEMQAVMSRLEATVIGHLHSPAILWTAGLLSGLPEVRGLGSTARRYTGALRKAEAWKPFRLRLCPSPTGIERLQDGGWLTVEFDPDSPTEFAWTRHRLPW